MARLSPHFDSDEFRCRCGCGWKQVDPLLIQRLEILRSVIRKPLPIVSGRRCPVHNQAVKGAGRSRHVHGDAADIPESLRVSIAMAAAAGFSGIGHKPSGWVTHVDVRPQQGQTVWRY